MKTERVLVKNIRVGDVLYWEPNNTYRVIKLKRCDEEMVSFEFLRSDGESFLDILYHKTDSLQRIKTNFNSDDDTGMDFL